MRSRKSKSSSASKPQNTKAVFCPSGSPSSASGWRKPLWAAWAAQHGAWITLSAAVLARIVHWICIRANDPFYAHTPPSLDMHTYWTWAQAIAAGDWLSRGPQAGPFFYGPLYPYFLAVLFRVFGVSFDAVHGAQALIGLVMPVLVWWMARRLFDEVAGLAAGFLAAVCAPIVFYEQILLVEGLLLAIHAGILVCLVALQESSRRRDLWAAAAGFLSGLACLGRGNFLMVVPVLAVACAVAPAIARRGNLPQSPTGSKPWAEIQNPRSKITNLAPVAVYLLAFVLPLSLTLWRNHYVSGQWVLITNNGPVLLYLGNASDSLGTSHYPASYFKVIKRYGSQYATPWLKELAEDVRAHPAEFIRLMLRKAWLFWNSYDIADNASYYAGKQFSWVLQWNPVAWLTVVPLAALGVWETRRQWRRQTILYAYATAFAISIILVSITGRYRLGALIPMLVWAGAGLAAIARELGARQWKGAGIRCGAAAVGIALLWPVWSPEVWRNVPEGQKGWRLVRGMDYANLALAYMDTNQRPRARKLLESIFDAYSLDFHVATQLAHLYIEDKQPNKGVSVLEPVLKTVGGDYYALIILAHAYYHAGQKTKAMMVVQQVLRENPNYEPALKTFEVLKAEGVAPEIMP